MTVSNNTPSPNNQPARPLNVKPKAASSGDPNAMIDRQMVAASLDRPGQDGTSPDGIVSDAEFSKAGIKVDAEAKGLINEGGESGDQITVSELSKSLMANRVAITGEGNVRIVDGFANMTNGRLQAAHPWSFPDLPGLRSLERVVDLAPRSFDGLNPDNPGSSYLERHIERVGSYSGQSLGSNQYVGDSSGSRLSPDSEGNYPKNAVVWREYYTVQWDELRDELERRARLIVSETSNATDPELQQINSQVRRLLNGGIWTSDESQARNLYSGMEYISRTKVPTAPKARMGGMDDSLNSAKEALNDHFRILQQVPVERARDVVSREAIRRKGPLTPSKSVGMGIGGIGAGVAGFFALAGSLAGAPLIAAAAGIGAAGLGLGWLIGKLIDGSAIKAIEKDLKVLETISPEANKQELQQYSMQAYKLLQDARTVSTLAKLRAYDEDAGNVQQSIDQEANKIRSQASSLRDIQKLVDKYANK